MGDRGCCVNGSKGREEVMTPYEVLTVEQVSEILGISRNTIQRRVWRERTGCPLRKKGKRLYSIVKEFNEWMKG